MQTTWVSFLNALNLAIRGTVLCRLQSRSIHWYITLFMNKSVANDTDERSIRFLQKQIMHRCTHETPQQVPVQQSCCFSKLIHNWVRGASIVHHFEVLTHEYSHINDMISRNREDQWRGNAQQASVSTFPYHNIYQYGGLIHFDLSFCSRPHISHLDFYFWLSSLDLSLPAHYFSAPSDPALPCFLQKNGINAPVGEIFRIPESIATAHAICTG